MNSRTLALVLLGGMVALLALAAGASSVVQALTAPDAVTMAQHARAAGLDAGQALTARTLAEAEKARAEAREIAARSWFATAEAALGLIACTGVTVFGGLVAGWGISLVQQAARQEADA